MTAVASSLPNLAQQLAQKQSELDDLRRAYQAHLAGLERRKQELEEALREVSAEIQDATQSGSPAAVAMVAPPSAPKGKVSAVTASQPVPATSAAAKDQLTLPQVLLRIVQKLARPLTVKELVDELVRCNYHSTSGNLAKLVRNRIDDLVKKGLFARSQSEDSMVVSLPKAAGKGSQAKMTSTLMPIANGPASKNGLPANPPPKPTKQTLRSLLEELLKKSGRLLKANELAERALAAGYQTKSKSFIDGVWTALGQMDNVENVSGQGYRLKRPAAKSK